MDEKTSRLTALKMIKSGGSDEHIEAATGFSLLEILGIRAETAARRRSIARLLRPQTQADRLRQPESHTEPA